MPVARLPGFAPAIQTGLFVSISSLSPEPGQRFALWSRGNRRPGPVMETQLTESDSQSTPERAKNGAAALYRLSFLTTGERARSLDVTFEAIDSGDGADIFSSSWIPAWSQRLVIAKALGGIRDKLAAPAQRTAFLPAENFAFPPRNRFSIWMRMAQEARSRARCLPSTCFRDACSSSRCSTGCPRRMVNSRPIRMPHLWPPASRAPGLTDYSRVVPQPD
jgi:hypothetical protein